MIKYEVGGQYLENLIFLPGASGHIEFWQPIIALLSTQYKKHVIAYPEFGGVPAQAGIQSFDDLQQHVIHSISYLSEQQPSIVIAQSMGGIFAVQAALQKPDKVKALILVATSGGIDLSPFKVSDWRKDYQLKYAVPDWFVEYHEYLDDALDQIQCPILLIWGDQDEISPVGVDNYLASKLMNAELHIIRGGQHDLAHVYSHDVSVLIQSMIEQMK